MFKRRNDLDKEVDRFVKYVDANGIGRGTEISWDDYDRMVKFPHDSYEGRQLFNKIRKAFLKGRGTKLVVQRGRGFYLQEASSQVLDDSRWKRAERQLFRARKEVQAVPASELSEFNRAVQERTVQALDSAQQQSVNNRRIVATMVSGHTSPFQFTKTDIDERMKAARKAAVQEAKAS